MDGWWMARWWEGWMDGAAVVAALVPQQHHLSSSVFVVLGAEQEKCAARCHRELLPVFHCFELYIQVQPCCLFTFL